jgi:hypothetical protein
VKKLSGIVISSALSLLKTKDSGWLFGCDNGCAITSDNDREKKKDNVQNRVVFVVENFIILDFVHTAAEGKC